MQRTANNSIFWYGMQPCRQSQSGRSLGSDNGLNLWLCLLGWRWTYNWSDISEDKKHPIRLFVPVADKAKRTLLLNWRLMALEKELQ